MAKQNRKAKKVTIDELKLSILKKLELGGLEDLAEDDEIEKFLDMYELFDACPKVVKDISKISFDFENTTFEPDGFRDYNPLAGFNQIDDFTFLGGFAGGDWEEPVFFLIYLDHKNQLRGYVPTEGNFFNKKTKEAFGNGDEADEKALGGEYGLTMEEYQGLSEGLYDWDKIKEDIKNRIVVI